MQGLLQATIDTVIAVPEQELWAVEGLLKLIQQEAADLGLSIQAPTVTLKLIVEHPATPELERFKEVLRDRHVIFETTALE